MTDIPKLIAQEFSLSLHNVSNALDLWLEGATVPFLARYRKEQTGSLDEVQLRDIFERYTYLDELGKRKEKILSEIEAQGKLTDELKQKIVNCFNKTELEDLYLPYKPKRRTRAMIAKEKGLESLAVWIEVHNKPQVGNVDLIAEAKRYIDGEKGAETAEQALAGAADILAEQIADDAEIRAYLRKYLFKKGFFVSKVKQEHPEGSTKYEMYRDYSYGVSKIPPHNVLALYRGESEGILTVDIAFEESEVMTYLEQKVINTKARELKEFYQGMLKDAFNRLLKPSLIRDIRSDRKDYADLESIQTFEANLRNLLLASPAGMKPTLAIDPGFRTGCKVAVLSDTGKYLKYQAIFPHTGESKRKQAEQIVKDFISQYNIQLIAIGNGTASRETDLFIGEVLKQIEPTLDSRYNGGNLRNALSPKPIKVIVNESGASIYSASNVAREEFPDLDITLRGAISIGRRLQDPLAELVKIDPKSIGVGQYQHDVNQKLLKQKLEESVESCVNYVGVDLNMASKELLTFVSGISATIANNIVAYRNEQGAFKNRKELLKVAKLGKKTYEQAAGFLRIRNGENPLDNTAVHPESYPVIKQIAKSLQVSLDKITTVGNELKNLDLKQFVTEDIGLPTLQDAIAELEKPGRDPREQFQYATFKEGVAEISDLTEGMILEGVVTNVVNFGAFVDVGVHQDGLVHISQLCDRFVSDPNKVVKVGEVVKVRVLEVNQKLKRIGLSIKQAG
ncbi:RNA-binding transcriptional accessory protein [Waterburya agarophytonicola K14]|uniref:RNA-binding transcriptional accessory protein n=1 Tax=Waterburya agarophytonicola KI4 TaxID=2874699 RepID=A0A964BSG4_9CYAN|nr:Tex family protein [Waterburya agarophytonicola]MCC0177906.1 RNA-binding transcriptional accessory protein [Waterburya agarophytonicola KI4]